MPGIPHRAIDYHAGYSALLQPRNHQFSDHGMCQVALRVDYDYVTGLGHIYRLMQQQVIAGPAFYGEGRAEQGDAVHRPDFAVNAGHPVHVVSNVRYRHAGEGFHQFPLGPFRGHKNSESNICHCKYLLIFFCAVFTV
jgi:hypothetical protein